MERNPVKSSNLAEVGYDAATQRLEVKFTGNGNVWEYHDVPAAVHEKMMAEKSIGSFFAREIKPSYKGNPVAPKEKPGVAHV